MLDHKTKPFEGTSNGACLAKEKSALRAEMKQRRQALPADKHALFSVHITERVFMLPEISGAQIVFIYLSHKDEVATPAIVERLLRAGKTVLVPRIVSRNRIVALRFLGWENLTRGPLGILCPEDSAEYTEPVDVVLTPGLAFSTTGSRLGFGAGYYDRWFSTHRADFKVGLSFESQLLPFVPTDTTDVLMDAVVTEERCVRPSVRQSDGIGR